MTRIEIMQLKRAAILLTTVAGDVKEPKAKIELLETVKILVKAIAELEEISKK